MDPLPFFFTNTGEAPAPQPPSPLVTALFPSPLVTALFIYGIYLRTQLLPVANGIGVAYPTNLQVLIHRVGSS